MSVKKKFVAIFRIEFEPSEPLRGQELYDYGLSLIKEAIEAKEQVGEQFYIEEIS
jgi:hypothetical protein